MLTESPITTALIVCVNIPGVDLNVVSYNLSLLSKNKIKPNKCIERKDEGRKQYAYYFIKKKKKKKKEIHKILNIKDISK